jgi:hypothetical protein
MKMLYRVSAARYPYADLVAGDARRGTDLLEYELLDTGIVFAGELLLRSSWYAQSPAIF